MASDRNHRASSERDTSSPWIRRLVISLTALAWVALIAVAMWLLAQISHALILLLLGALIATVIYPLVVWLEKVMPRPLAIAIVYILVLGAIGVLLYFCVNLIIEQLMSLTGYVQSLVNANGNQQLQPILDKLHQIGISQAQLKSWGQNLVAQLRGLVDDIIPFVSNLFGFFFNVVLIALLSIYFLLTGPRIVQWLRNRTPIAARGQITFLLRTLERVIGGNFRGLLLLAAIMAVLTAIGLFIIGVPYVFLLSVLTFVLEFIPVIGFYITAVSIVLLALTQGWTVGLLALALVSVLQLLEGEVLSPRIIGHAIGINPILMIGALIAGSQLFGLIGAFLAGSAASFIQSIIVEYWSYWKKNHPDQFPDEEQEQEKRQEQGQGASSRR